MNSTRHLRGWVVAAALLVAAVAVIGCGGSSSSSASGSSTTSSSSRDAARVKYAKCLRDNGVDVPDDPQGAGAQALQNVDQTKLQAAMKACQKYQQDAVGNISSGQQQQFRDAFTKFSACMRQHGVEVPDIGTGNGPPTGGNQLDQSDPKVKAATSACQDKLPQGGPGGGQGGS